MGEKILVVECSNEIRENTAELLELKNYRVLTAVDGYSGYELAKQYTPDLVICDLVMPATKGYAFLQLFEKDALICNIPVIVFLESLLCCEENKKWERIAKVYVCKPFTGQDLFEGVALGLSIRNTTCSNSYNA